MALFPNFRRRKLEAKQTAQDVFVHDQIPSNVRVQLQMVMASTLEAVCNYNNPPQNVFAQIVSDMREEKGTYSLVGLSYNVPSQQEFEGWFSKENSIDYLLSAIEHWWLYASWVNDQDYKRKSKELEAGAARLNARLLEAGIGYELVDGQIIEKSSEFIHQEAVLPALHVLAQSRFANANSEFREAFEAYKSNEYEDCLTDCLKAFESVMKVIAADKGWGLADNATAKPLIAALFDNKYVPSYMQSQFAGLRTMLESSVPTTRNKVGGHGKGVEVRVVPKSLAAFQLHQTAAIIVFLAELDV